MTHPFDLSGKRILITGASSGIGRQTAILCSKMGASLIITGRDNARLEETLSMLDEPGKHEAIVADLTDATQLAALIDSVADLSGVFACAGKAATLPISFASQEKMADMLQTNLYPTLELARLCYKKKKIVRESSVVIMSSLGGTRIFSGSNGCYGISKAALLSLTKYMAYEFAGRRIRVNAITPGMVETPLIHRGTISDEQLKENEKLYPLGRYGRPEDIANAAVYLLSDASAWMTGQELVLDGGISLK